MLNIDGTFTELLLQLAIEILKEHTLINALTLITTTPKIYMQQFWYIINENPNTNKYRFHLDNQEFELGEEHFRIVLRTSQRIDDQPFTDPPLQNTLLEFTKRLDHDEIEKPLDMISQVILGKLNSQQKLKGIKQISLAAQSLLDLKRGTKLSRQEEMIQEMLDDDVNLNRVNLEGEGDEASNYTIFVHNEKQKAKEK
ncbi:hypothetical protein Tco_0520186 [Tanacetum coccineum]